MALYAKGAKSDNEAGSILNYSCQTSQLRSDDACKRLDRSQ
jgi:hypothetical protein